MAVIARRVSGTVSAWILKKGFGFIRLDDELDDVDDPEIFVHRNDVNGRDRLREGDRVTVDVVETEKGPGAVSVTSPVTCVGCGDTLEFADSAPDRPMCLFCRCDAPEEKA